jgi:hypothetical protein
MQHLRIATLLVFWIVALGGVETARADVVYSFFVTTDSRVGAYTTAGDTVNPALILGVNYNGSGLPGSPGFAVVATPVPEPSSLTFTLFGIVFAGPIFRWWCKRAS